MQGFGFMVLSLTAYLSRLWKVMYLIAGIVLTLHSLISSAFLPESPTWLLAKGRRGDVINFIYKVSRFNARSLKDKFYIIETEKKNPNESVTSEPELFLTTVACIITWILLHVAEYTLYFNVSYLPGNAYLNLLLLGLCDIPGRLLPLVLVEKFGCKKTLLLLNMIVSATLFACCYGNKIVRSVFFMMSKLLLAGNLITIKIYTHELSPRTTNSEMMKICMGSVRLVGCGVPFLTILNSLSFMYIYIVAGGCVFLSLFFVLPLPNSKSERLETVKDFVGLFYSSKLKIRSKKVKEKQAISQLPRAVTLALAGQHAQGIQPGSTNRSKNSNSNSNGRKREQTAMYRKPKNASSNESIDISAISNTGYGNLSINDPDLNKFKYDYHSNKRFMMPSTSTPVNSNGNLPTIQLPGSSNHSNPVRPSSLTLESQQRPLLRNPSYESSLDTPSLVKSESLDEDTETFKQNSMADIPHKSSVRKQFFSLSRV